MPCTLCVWLVDRGSGCIVTNNQRWQGDVAPRYHRVMDVLAKLGMYNIAESRATKARYLIIANTIVFSAGSVYFANMRMKQRKARQAMSLPAYVRFAAGTFRGSCDARFAIRFRDSSLPIMGYEQLHYSRQQPSPRLQPRCKESECCLCAPSPPHETPLVGPSLVFVRRDLLALNYQFGCYRI